MYKIAIIQVIQKTKISYQYIIKKLFKLLNKEIKILLTLFLFSCSDYSVKSQYISPEKIICEVSSNQSLDKNIHFISKNSKNFENILASIDKNLNKDSFNLVVFSGYKPSSGYKLKLNNIKKILLMILLLLEADLLDIHILIKLIILILTTLALY